MPEQKRVEGLVHFVVYRSDATGYSVVKIYEGDHLPEPQQVDDSDLTTVVGIMPDLSRGDSIQADGKWIENKRYGTQFDARQVQVMEAPPEPLFFQNAGNSRNSDEGDPEATVEGIVERITYYNAENSWCVVKISPEGKIPEDALMTDNTMAVVGVMPELVEGETVRFTGKWTQNRQYGLQLKADTTTPIAPDTKYGVVRYLADTVHGVGERTATKIYDFLGDDTINILDTDPQRIHDVPGIKSQIAENVLEAWATERKLRQVMINLQNFGISTLIARRIYDVYEGSALQVVQSDPYQLAQSIQSIGFRKADGIARRVGIEADAPQRLRAGLHYALQQMSNEGHCFSPREHLVSTACDLLGIAPDNHDILTGLLDTEIRAERLIQQQLVIDDTTLNAVYLPIYFRSEVGATERMNLMQETPSKIIFRMKTLDEAEYLKELAEQNNVELSDQQQGAVWKALTGKVSVLTGGPGTGKTTTLRMVINALDEQDFSFALASPTGRAAKRLWEATGGREAMTIHRLLKWIPGQGFDHDEDDPLDTDFVVIDEASMLDVMLFYSLLKAIRPGSHLMLVGDVDQLPSVGAGNVLRDVIESGIAHVTRLDRIFRQKERSHIVLNAHRINEGQMPFTDNQSDDFFFFNFSDAGEASDMVVDIVKNRLPQKFGIGSLDEIQVIAPMYKSPVGVNNLNEKLQAAMNNNPHMAEKKLGGKLFRVGDKVMQTKNDYNKDVFNGDIGYVEAIDFDDKKIHVIIDNRPVEYEYLDAAEQLIHAYCISTHRSQGAEYPVVVMPLMMQHRMMLQRNLLYTAITRAKQLVVLVGDRRAVGMAVNNNKVAERYTGLELRLHSIK